MKRSAMVRLAVANTQIDRLAVGAPSRAFGLIADIPKLGNGYWGTYCLSFV
jgi:hypothetical protein